MDISGFYINEENEGCMGILLKFRFDVLIKLLFNLPFCRVNNLSLNNVTGLLTLNFKVLFKNENENVSSVLSRLKCKFSRELNKVTFDVLFVITDA